ncbi:uncharacterized protein RCC_04827 [Ramularia collo-cygni]|uniref:C2H2-type domain-containing protein n=1 Tax=Ramularia collo-cygni TaxID=112498 RepID=A0A2D3UQ98_9PEZI|nr:uncharacterized protein RCC_04827 [Ramularia collo-cygni]CZT18982.1 uncharacterized protein RCC_04827 [Ramularia collo-cygni]
MANTVRAEASGSTLSTNTTLISSRAPRVPYQQKSFSCNVEGCQHFFDTLEEMKQHKKYDPEHFYCKKCDFDAEDWDDLTRHKVENMVPYIEGAKGRVKPLDDDLKHITCEFCGEDFKSFGGRKRHRQMAHPADQDITCPGCEGKFIRASHLIQHFEKGRCHVYSARVFHDHLQHKHIVDQIMAAPDRAFHPPRLLSGKYGVSIPENITDGGETLDQDFGGVSLMDQQDEAQMGGYKPMEAEKDLIDLHTQSNLEAWPSLSGQEPAQLSESLRKGSLAVPFRSTATSTKRSDGIAQGGGRKVYTESYPGLASSSAVSTSGDDARSESTITTPSVVGGGGAWSTGQTPFALFPNAKGTAKARPKAGDWDAILAQHAEEAKADTGADMLKIAWWDPTSEDYDIARFRHPVYEAYFCPFPSCEDAVFGNSFDSQSDIENHIKYCHTRTKFRCEGCFRHFKSAAPLVAHVESTRKCGIRGSEKFGKFFESITAGFLKSKYVGEPKIYRLETALAKQGQPTGGIMSTAFKAKQPNIW